MLTKTISLIALLAAAPAGVALAQQAQDQTAETEAAMAEPVTDAATFAQMAASSNMFEINSSQLALEQSQNEDVRAFATHMIEDHKAAGEDMKAAAEEADVTVPEGMTEADMQAYNDLEGASDFDQAYLQAQATAHDKAVALFQGFAENGEDGPLKDFAAETLPVLQEHKERVDELTGS